MTYEGLKQRIAGLSVTNLEGKEVPLEHLWQDRRIVLVFLRHFG
ncbi:MAG TPA: hypothetical protein PLW83_01500 [Deltaproteobacteria bacterium]|nr:hypothetical protein [Deltaproteobacteria bacterium]